MTADLVANTFYLIIIDEGQQIYSVNYFWKFKVSFLEILNNWKWQIKNTLQSVQSYFISVWFVTNILTSTVIGVSQFLEMTNTVQVVEFQSRKS